MTRSLRGQGEPVELGGPGRRPVKFPTNRGARVWLGGESYLVIDGAAIAECRVKAFAVVEDLDVFE